MKRVIKFRLWDGKRFIFWELWESVFTEDYLYDNQDKTHQFTGLHDKNGKEIYEGDYIKRYNYLYEVIFDEKTARFGYRVVARLDDSVQDRGWIPEKPKTNIYGLPIIYRFTNEPEIITEIIGNIHENPELIKPTT